VGDETPRIAFIGALAGEIAALRDAMLVEAQGRDAGFGWWAGELAGRRVVLAQGGMGKVAAAACCQRLIDGWNLEGVVVCGLAGGLDQRLRPGDIVVAVALLQHDVDASPIFPRFELPGLGLSTLRPPQAWIEAATAAASGFLEGNPLDIAVLESNGIKEPRVLSGLIVTGDRFIEADERMALHAALPEALCVEMEGAAIAQVCYLNELPFCAVRVMSDNADADAAFDFLRFVRDVAPVYVHGIVSRLLPRLESEQKAEGQSAAG
jgi:adenosylhomocysteine nucleosidase